MRQSRVLPVAAGAHSMTTASTRTDAPGDAIPSSCAYCAGPIPTRRRGRYCCPAHRTAYLREFGMRGIVSRVSILKSSEVSVTVRFGPDDIRALGLTPGSVVEVTGS